VPKITYVSFDGQTQTVDVKEGMSVMEAAVRNDVPGIDGECGGACACSTCHVLVDPEWLEQVGSAGAMELDLLQAASEVGASSRLACQIRVTRELDGLIVRTPQSQQSAM
jgi:2Fe-2S ferredoxin